VRPSIERHGLTTRQVNNEWTLSSRPRFSRYCIILGISRPFSSGSPGVTTSLGDSRFQSDTGLLQIDMSLGRPGDWAELELFL